MFFPHLSTFPERNSSMYLLIYSPKGCLYCSTQDHNLCCLIWGFQCTWGFTNSSDMPKESQQWPLGWLYIFISHRCSTCIPRQQLTELKIPSCKALQSSRAVSRQILVKQRAGVSFLWQNMSSKSPEARSNYMEKYQSSFSRGSCVEIQKLYAGSRTNS